MGTSGGIIEHNDDDKGSTAVVCLQNECSDGNQQAINDATAQVVMDRGVTVGTTSGSDGDMGRQ